jgi:hypothetical protein
LFLQVPLDQYFPEFTGGTDFDECSEYILRRFLHFPMRRQVYS